MDNSIICPFNFIANLECYVSLCSFRLNFPGCPYNGWSSLCIDPDNIGQFYFCVPFVCRLIQECFWPYPGQWLANTTRYPGQWVVTLWAALDNGHAHSTPTLTARRASKAHYLLTVWKNIYKRGHNQPLASQTWDYAKKGGQNLTPVYL